MKNEQRFPLYCVYISLQRAAQPGIGGRSENENRGNVYITFAAGK